MTTIPQSRPIAEDRGAEMKHIKSLVVGVVVTTLVLFVGVGFVALCDHFFKAALLLVIIAIWLFSSYVIGTAITEERKDSTEVKEPKL